MREEFRPAIEALQKDLADAEKKVVETKTMINRLCEMAACPAMYPDVGEANQAAITSIRADTFYGKSLITAAHEFLDMRKAANLGPCSPRDIYEALKKGGFRFETTVENNAITTVRAMVRKNSSIFHRLPNGEYGLLSWYPKAKQPKASANRDEEEEIEEELETETAATQRDAAAA